MTWPRRCVQQPMGNHRKKHGQSFADAGRWSSGCQSWTEDFVGFKKELVESESSSKSFTEQVLVISHIHLQIGNTLWSLVNFRSELQSDEPIRCSTRTRVRSAPNKSFFAEDLLEMLDISALAWKGEPSEEFLNCRSSRRHKAKKTFSINPFLKLKTCCLVYIGGKVLVKDGKGIFYPWFPFERDNL